MAFWLLIDEASKEQIGEPYEEEPTPGEGQYFVLAPLGFPDLYRWSAAKGWFEDIPSRMVTTLAFKLLFTQTERIALKAARASDPVIDDYWDLVDSAPNGIDLAHPVIGFGLDYLITQSIIAPERKAIILANTPPA